MTWMQQIRTDFICVSHLNQRYQRSICSIEYPKVEECDATGDDSSNTVWFIKKIDCINE